MNNPLQPEAYQDRKAVMLPAHETDNLEADIDNLLTILLPVARQIVLQNQKIMVESSPRKTVKFG